MTGTAERQSSQSSTNNPQQDDWTVSFTALPPGWVNVYETKDREVEFSLDPCPGLALREIYVPFRRRVIVPVRLPRQFDSEFGTIHAIDMPVDDGYLTTTTLEDWRSGRDEWFAEMVTRIRQRVRVDILNALSDEWVRGNDLCSRIDPNHDSQWTIDLMMGFLVADGVVERSQHGLRLAQS